MPRSINFHGLRAEPSTGAVRVPAASWWNGQIPVSRVRRSGVRESVVCTLLVLSVLLGSLMNIAGVTTPQRGAILLVLLIGMVLSLPGGSLVTTAGRLAAIVAFVGCTAVSYLRFAAAPVGAVPGRTMFALALMLIVVTVFALCALLAPSNLAVRRRRLLCILFAPLCFVMIDLLLYFLNFHFPGVQYQQSANNGSAQLLNLLGVHATRAALPLTPGLNGGGEAGALALVIGAILARRSQGKVRWLALMGAISGLTVILITDSRGPLVYALLALIILTALPHVARRAVAVVPILLPLAPAIILFLARNAGSLGETLNRSQGRGSFANATGRGEIWSIVGQYLSHPRLEDLIGFGAFGQIKSGVASQYAYLFSYSENPEFMSVHNLALQTILDAGYIGLGVLLWFLVVVINSARVSYESSGSPESAALLVALVALSLFGASEALPGLAGIYLLIAMIGLACAAIRLPTAWRRRPGVHGAPRIPSASDGSSVTAGLPADPL